MFSVLVVALCPDRVAELGFSTGERQVSLIASLGVLRAPRLGAGGARCPPVRADSQWCCWSGLAHTHDCLWVILL